MRYGLISDIHGNLPALRAALDALNEAGIDRLICLGDLVGYGANPAEVIDLVRQQPNLTVIAGNHDRQVRGRRDPRMREQAAEVLDWTREHLGPADLDWLAGLSQGLMLDDDQILVIHGALTERDAYILNVNEIRRNLEVMLQEYPDFRICFFGHTHVPLIVSPKVVVTDLKATKTLNLDQNEVYLVNPGSVGQPRDKCPLASAAIFDSERWSLTIVRTEYDIESAQGAITSAGLPERLAERLATGS
jgi:predicted phosphodiesterase